MNGDPFRWRRWFPAAEPTRPGWWRLIRFEQVDANGAPVGKPVVSLSPTLHPRMFRTESIAQAAADEQNRTEGRD